MNLDAWRRRIDEGDGELLRLLNERARNAREIGHEKKKAGLPISDPDREAQVLQHIRKLNGGPLSDEAVEAVFRKIIRVCLDLEMSDQP